MKITNARLIALGIAAAVLTIVAGILYWPGKPKKSDVEKDALLIQGLDLNKIRQITIDSKDNDVSLSRRDKTFVVDDRSNYPAATEKVNGLITKVLDIRCAEKVSGSAKSHEELGVEEDSEDATVIRFFGEDKDKPLIAVVLGKYSERGSGVYVRLLSKDTVYASKESVWISKGPTDYMDTDLIKVDKADIEKVSVSTPDGSYLLTPKDGKVVLDSVPDKKQPKQSELDSVFEALTSSVYFSDVMKEGEKKLEWKNMYSAQLSTHLTYILQLAGDGDKHYTRLRLIGPSNEQIQQSSQIRTDASKEDLEKKDAVLQAMDKAKEFNEKHSGWVYELSSWTAEKLCKPKKDLVEDIPDPDDPEEIAASHILVSYKGADRADAKITRSREDAKKRAEELLQQAKADDADFAKLAEANSDGPSKTKGGDLGTFKKGAMHKNFEAAAWKLKVGEVSDIVETPFGFHIIKRTK